MKYQFTVLDENEEVVFQATKPTIEMMEEEIGRFERNIKKQYVTN